MKRINRFVQLECWILRLLLLLGGKSGCLIIGKSSCMAMGKLRCSCSYSNHDHLFFSLVPGERESVADEEDQLISTTHGRDRYKVFGHSSHHLPPHHQLLQAAALQLLQMIIATLLLVSWFLMKSGLRAVSQPVFWRCSDTQLLLRRAAASSSCLPRKSFHGINNSQQSS